ncbi:MAG TPA: protein phosphatase 2C domain-containing protein [Pirellulales bacterium]|nr:protein phosphatase 2C domain-containing protein [Pirellulales bacterium]
MAESDTTWLTFVEHAALSDVGLRRSNNQDSYSVVMASDQQNWRSRGHLFLVADGMGAHAAGELASKLAAGGIPHTYHKLLDQPPPEALRQAIVESNATIHGRGEANAEFHGMGTTTSVLVLLPQGAIAGQVGDSRVYRCRQGCLEQLTFDHSLVWEMMATGQLPAGDIANFIPKNIITRSLGPHAEVKVDLEGPFPLAAGDTFVLCSDGLSGQVKDEQIAAILNSMAPAEAARALVDLANLQGGPDNVTVIVARVGQPPPITADDQTFHVRPTPPRTSSLPALAGWVVLGVAVLTAAALAVIGHKIGAAISLGVAVAVPIGAWLRQMATAPEESATTISGPFGAGPYRRYDGAQAAETLGEFNQLLAQLREAAREQNWLIDWPRLETFLSAASTARGAGDLTAATRQTALAISFLMDQIRQQRKKQPPPDAARIEL